MTLTIPTREPWKWADTPSATIAGDPRITAREHHFHGEQNATSYRLDFDEAMTLQTYPPFPIERSAMQHEHQIVVDLFAGTGVGVAVKALGAREFGVENMPEAIATREANGMDTIYEDVWDAHLLLYTMLKYGIDLATALWTLWGSPPCQTFSLAGGGTGRRALDDVLAIIHHKQYLDMAELREQSALLGDERIGLVLSPLYYAARFAPTYIALEQVPPVLPVWEAMAIELREMGYSVWVGLLHAEQYGVPQTRKRAILMARRDGVEATPPAPTHSKYHNRDKTRLDPGVKKWVSMAEALGWSNEVTMRSNYGTGGDASNRGERSTDQPAPTVTSKIGRNKWVEAGANVTAPEAASLQSYPEGFKFVGGQGKKFLQVGNACPPLLTQRILEALWATPAAAEVVDLDARRPVITEEQAA